MELEAGKVFPGSLRGLSPAQGAALALISLLRWDINPFAGITVSMVVATLCRGLGTGFCVTACRSTHPPVYLLSMSRKTGSLPAVSTGCFCSWKTSFISIFSMTASPRSHRQDQAPFAWCPVHTGQNLSTHECPKTAAGSILDPPSSSSPVPGLAGGEHPQRQESFASCFLLDLPLLPNQGSPGERLCSGMELMPGSCQELQTGR